MESWGESAFVRKVMCLDANARIESEAKNSDTFYFEGALTVVSGTQDWEEGAEEAPAFITILLI